MLSWSSGCVGSGGGNVTFIGPSGEQITLSAFVMSGTCTDDGLGGCDESPCEISFSWSWNIGPQGGGMTMVVKIMCGSDPPSVLRDERKALAAGEGDSGSGAFELPCDCSIDFEICLTPTGGSKTCKSLMPACSDCP